VFGGKLPTNLVPAAREPLPELLEVQVVGKEQDMEVRSNPALVHTTLTILKLQPPNSRRFAVQLAHESVGPYFEIPFPSTPICGELVRIGQGDEQRIRDIFRD
jgi:hypothetical protein